MIIRPDQFRDIAYSARTPYAGPIRECPVAGRTRRGRTGPRDAFHGPTGPGHPLLELPPHDPLLGGPMPELRRRLRGRHGRRVLNQPDKHGSAAKDSPRDERDPVPDPCGSPPRSRPRSRHLDERPAPAARPRPDDHVPMSLVRPIRRGRRPQLCVRRSVRGVRGDVPLPRVRLPRPHPRQGLSRVRSALRGIAPSELFVSPLRVSRVLGCPALRVRGLVRRLKYLILVSENRPRSPLSFEPRRNISPGIRQRQPASR